MDFIFLSALRQGSNLAILCHLTLIILKFVKAPLELVLAVDGHCRNIEDKAIARLLFVRLSIDNNLSLTEGRCKHILIQMLHLRCFYKLPLNIHWWSFKLMLCGNFSMKSLNTTKLSLMSTLNQFSCFHIVLQSDGIYPIFNPTGTYMVSFIILRLYKSGR